MNKSAHIVILALCTSVICGGTQSHASEFNPLANLVASSDTIAVVRVVSYHEAPLDSDYNAGLPLVARGTYELNESYQIKGQLPNSFTVTLPPEFYTPFVHQIPPVRAGDTLLVFLKKNGMEYVPASAWTSYCPVLVPPSFKSNDGAPADEVLSLLCYTINDTSLRPLIASKLMFAKDPRAVVAMASCVQDGTDTVKLDALICMSINSQVAAIPLIANYANELMKKDESPVLVAGCLSNYTSKEAVPYLNALLWNQCYDVRVAAMEGLENSANMTSAPYLILALRDPQPGFGVSMLARTALAAHILNEIQPYEETTQFIANYSSEVKPFYAWWSAELMGEHLDKTDRAAVLAQTREESQAIPGEVQSVNVLLFKPYPTLRERAIIALAKVADASSRPYLVLALQDPDPLVSYDAYVILKRLIGDKTAAMSKDEYAANQDVATKPLYQWWSREILEDTKRVDTETIIR